MQRDTLIDAFKVYYLFNQSLLKLYLLMMDLPITLSKKQKNIVIFSLSFMFIVFPTKESGKLAILPYKSLLVIMYGLSTAMTLFHQMH